MLKPDRVIYELTCERLGVRPEEAISLDEMQEFVDGARADSAGGSPAGGCSGSTGPTSQAEGRARDHAPERALKGSETTTKPLTRGFAAGPGGGRRPRGRGRPGRRGVAGLAAKARRDLSHGVRPHLGGGRVRGVSLRGGRAGPVPAHRRPLLVPHRPTARACERAGSRNGRDGRDGERRDGSRRHPAVPGRPCGGHRRGSGPACPGSGSGRSSPRDAAPSAMSTP